jgi:hypothetical protein
MLHFSFRHPDDDAQEARDAEVIDQFGDRQRLLARDIAIARFSSGIPIIGSFPMSVVPCFILEVGEGRDKVEATLPLGDLEPRLASGCSLGLL